LNFGAWNVQGCRNKVEEIIREIDITKIDVVVLTETKRRKQEVKHRKTVYTILAGEEI
jgi:exonuclease III